MPAPPAPKSYRLLVLGGPWALGVVGLVLIVASFLAHNTPALAGVYVAPGTGLLIAAVFLPRAKGKIAALGVDAEIITVEDALAFAKATLEGALPPEPARDAKIDAVLNAAAAQLLRGAPPLEAARRAGLEHGYAIGHTVGATSITFTRVRDGRVENHVVSYGDVARAARAAAGSGEVRAKAHDAQGRVEDQKGG
jgi:hypothetical protein